MQFGIISLEKVLTGMLMSVESKRVILILVLATGKDRSVTSIGHTVNYVVKKVGVAIAHLQKKQSEIYSTKLGNADEMSICQK